jgi:ferredoxin--NADP+ reductase
MYKITQLKELSKDIKLMSIEAPHVVQNAGAGNFVIVIPAVNGERVPLTIYDWDSAKGIVHIIFQEVGLSTVKLGAMKPGEEIYAIAGPLGRRFHADKYGHVAVIGGGVGVPAIFPIARQLRALGNQVTSITGFRTKDLVILEKEMQSVSDKALIGTNDGSYGKQGLVTGILKEMLDGGEKVDLVVAVGPVVMMKAVSDITRNHNIRTVVSLNALMLDGTGMCGGCRVTVGGENKFACVDGPDFDGHLVDFTELSNRLSAYKAEEKIALDNCRLAKGGDRA